MDGLIPDEIVDRVRSGTDIVELVSEYVTLKRTGANYLGLCPFHQEKTPSFTVSPAKQIFHCFGCGAGGDATGFLIRQENYTFPEAIRRLADRAGIIIPETHRVPGRSREDYEALQKVNEEALVYFEKCLWDSKEGERARGYLEKRDMAGDIARKFNIGFSMNSWDGLLKFLEKKGFGAEVVEKAGLALKKTSGQGHYDRFRDRVMFPIRDYRGRVIGFGGRTMGDDTPKYLNSPETPLFRKGETLYAIDAAAGDIRKKGHAVIVEGYFDAIACHKAGVTNAVATMGTALTASHLRLLGRYSKNVKLVFDSDPAGIKAAERSLDIFLGTDMVPKVSLLPQGDDPDSLVRREGAQGLAKGLGKSEKLMDFVIGLYTKNAQTIEEKVAAVSVLTSMLAKVENSVERSYYLKKSAEELRVEESALMEELNKKLGRTGAYKAPRKPAETGLNHIEEGLLHIILNHPEVAAEVREALTPVDFSGPGIQALVNRIFGQMDAGGEVNIPRLLDSTEDEALKKLILKLTLKKSVDDPGGFAAGAIKRLTEARRSSRYTELQARIKQAEEQKDFELLDKLQKELYEWQKRKSWRK